MATRLYPNTKNPASLERLAGVRPGTYDRLQVLKEALEKVWPEDFTVEGNEDGMDQGLEPGYLRYQAIQLDPELEQLETFLTYGWNRVRFAEAQTDLIEQTEELGCGSTTDLVDCNLIFKVMGLDRDLLLYTEGLHWG